MIEDIKVILFDLGNVFVYLDEESSYHAFADLSQYSYEALKSKVKEETFFNAFERGQISEDAFRDELKKLLKEETVSDKELDSAWNKMLLRIDPDIVKAIKELSKNKQVMVLSNTNIIHERAFHKMLFQVSGISHLDQFFHKVYLSHEIGERKPDHSSWQFILEDNPGMKPDEVLFLDDKSENLEAARQMNFQVKQINNAGETLEYLKMII